MGSTHNDGERITAITNDNIQIALIGAGGMGQSDAHQSSSLPGVKLVAACDLYTSRLEHCKEIWGQDIFATRDYREILARPDIDAIIIGTPDHWHSRITIDALNAGKDVYCEKPMVQKISQGKEVIAAQQKTGRILQIGSQYASSVAFLKARQLLAAGAIGKLNMVEAWLDRNSAMGAWQYSIPQDASPQTVDWDRYLSDLAPRRPFDAMRFFRWRNYQDYGTGVAGDLFVHLLTGLHVVTGAIGPRRVYATGGLRYWKDGRDVPDVMLAVMDYPDFTFTLRVNFKSSVPRGEAFGLRFVGSEGNMMVTMDDLHVSKQPRESEPGYTVDTFSAVQQQAVLAAYREKYRSQTIVPEQLPSNDTMHYTQPRGYSSHLEHHRNFMNAVRTRKPFFEDGVFGFRTAGPSLLTTASMNEGKVCLWDAESMTRTG